MIMKMEEDAEWTDSRGNGLGKTLLPFDFEL